MVRIMSLMVALIMLVGCVHYTAREKWAIREFRRGNRRVFDSLTIEELDVLEAKLKGEQQTYDAISASARGFAESTRRTLKSPQYYYVPEQQSQKQDGYVYPNEYGNYEEQSLYYQKKQAEALEGR